MRRGRRLGRYLGMLPETICSSHLVSHRASLLHFTGWWQMHMYMKNFCTWKQYHQLLNPWFQLNQVSSLQHPTFKSALQHSSFLTLIHTTNLPAASSFEVMIWNTVSYIIFITAYMAHGAGVNVWSWLMQWWLVAENWWSWSGLKVDEWLMPSLLSQPLATWHAAVRLCTCSVCRKTCLFYILLG